MKETSRYKCDMCDNTFSHRSSLGRHKTDVHGIGADSKKKFNCVKCPYTTYHKGSLSLHLRTHSEERPYKCKLCKMSFKQRCHLQSHERVRHGIVLPNQVKIKCPDCEYTAFTKGSLNVHMRIHTGERPFKCNLCAAAFKTSSNLNVHMRSHTGDKPFKCTYENCTFTTKTTSNLHIHTRIHTGDRPYKCTLCDSTFTSSSVLYTHQRTHTGKRPHQCDVCSKGFSQLGYLKIHKRIHTGEKPFNCDLCGDAFTQKSGLESHQRDVHGIKLPKHAAFKCDQCPYTTLNRKLLKLHSTVHTGEKPYKQMRVM